MDFYKYQGTGNDFIIVDNRNNLFTNKSKENIANLCHRKFGIGADGLILLEQCEDADFYMQYFNNDGAESSMCGNGGRCLAAFAHYLKIGSAGKMVFKAIDGYHEAIVKDNNYVSLKMNDVFDIKILTNSYELNTGSPHYVTYENDLKSLAITEAAHKIRYSSTYKQQGINVNYVQTINNNNIKVRTYERGVEDETLSCGTGVTACAIVHGIKNNFVNGDYEVVVLTPGGKLFVTYKKSDNVFTNVWLTGEAVQVFSGNLA